MESFIQFTKLNRPQGIIAGLRPGEIHVLFGLKKATRPGEPGIKVSELGNLLKVTSPTITQFINNLEARGFVARVPDREDRRVVRLRLTEEGERAIRQAHEALLASFYGLVNHLGEEKSKKLADLIAEALVYLRGGKDARPEE